jgi:hypothetical protein
VEDDTFPDLDAEDLEGEVRQTPDGTVPCRECTILIGPGYVESEPIPHPQVPGKYVCWRCYESLQRQADRRARAERLGQEPPPENPLRRFPRR